MVVEYYAQLINTRKQQGDQILQQKRLVSYCWTTKQKNSNSFVF